ncbi:hypothetical protein [Anoxybacillus sp. KU2-6(11)]|uniref:hypothetical protein n=1 Tax=Anoxybacillus sp. KU2-6(11) TaxID=1535751 RepID=UPI000B14FC6A|nr:hypothetical protein [Anoxybacillus sp. KU2-6(11)]
MHILQLAIPPDFPLPIPGNLSLLEFLIVLTFILHIVFVNFTLSFATGAVALEGAGIVKKSKRLDDMARICSFHASIHKSIAVVLGVAPLLIVSVIYTQYFYTSTLLIGKAWISIIVLLITAFLLLYVYKFSWEKWENKKRIALFRRSCCIRYFTVYSVDFYRQYRFDVVPRKMVKCERIFP